MATSIISSPVTLQVTPGVGSYSSNLTITTAGTILPPDSFTSPLYVSADISGVVLVNDGSIAPPKYAAAMEVLAPATVYNKGKISGGIAGVELSEGGTITNAGQVSGGDYGINLSRGSLDNSGTVSSEDVGVLDSGGTIQNTGLIYGVGYSFVNDAGVRLDDNGLLNNQNGTIRSGRYGVIASYGGTIMNTGTISGDWGGVVLSNTSTLVNQGKVYGRIGLQFYSGDSLSNLGAIIGTAVGVIDNNTSLTNAGLFLGKDAYGLLFDYGTITNYGTIYGGLAGIHGVSEIASDQEYIYNSGTIGGGTAAIYLRGQINLTVAPGGTFQGAVDDAAGIGHLTLAGTTAGSLNMGSSFTGFEQISFSSTAQWVLEGAQDGLSAGQTIDGFSELDTIILDGFTATSHSYVSGIGLQLSNGDDTITVGIEGSFSTDSFVVTDSVNGTEIALCYLAGTRILSPSGERLVEDLRCGDQVVTHSGLQRSIKWIGRQSYEPAFLSRARQPVRIAPGALGQGIPTRSLFVSPGHAVLIGNQLLLAKNLVNGISITQDRFISTVHYFAIELETHDCVMAEGAWAESFADGPGLRNQFHNQGEFRELFPKYAEPDEIHLCAQRPEVGRELEIALLPFLSRLSFVPGPLCSNIEIAGPDKIEGWAFDTANPDTPVLLEIFTDTKFLGTAVACHYRLDLELAGLGRGHCMFSFALPRTAKGPFSIYRAVDGISLRSDIPAISEK